MKPIVVYLFLHVPWAPPGERETFYRLPAVSYETHEACEEEAPLEAAIWAEMRERAGQGGIQIRRVVCFDTRHDVGA